MANGPYGFQPDSELGAFELAIIVICVCLFAGAWGIGLIAEWLHAIF